MSLMSLRNRKIRYIQALFIVTRNKYVVFDDGFFLNLTYDFMKILTTIVF